MKESTREQKIEFLIRETWKSLESHLPYIHKPAKKYPHYSKKIKTINIDFEKQCIKDYADMILTLTELF